MKEHKVFIHPQGAKDAVKVGWSWPAFFFTATWALVKKMWAIGFVGFGIFIGIGIIKRSLSVRFGDGLPPMLDGFFTLVPFIVAAIFGSFGNYWRAKNLQSKGYEFKDNVNAIGPKGAILRWDVKESVSAEN